jgi:uroporphyrinogen III methyltransferase/synthase
MLEEGAEPATPVALVRWGTTGRQKTLRGTLADIAKKVKETGFTAPAVAVFGSVAALGEKLNWFEKKPLFGKRVVVTRTRHQAGALSEQLRALGADVYELPTIRIERPKELLEFGELVRDAHTYDWVVFTSPNGVDAFFDLFYKIYDDAREIGGPRIAAIGAATAARLKEFHMHVDLCPEQAVAEGLIKAFVKDGSVENLKMLIIRPETARDLLSTELTKMGAIVDQAIAYRTVPETETAGATRFREEGADLITFTSSSTVENFMALNLPLPEGLRTASIGPVTSKTMRELGLRIDIEAKRHDIEGLSAAIRDDYSH